MVTPIATEILPVAARLIVGQIMVQKTTTDKPSRTNASGSGTDDIANKPKARHSNNTEKDITKSILP